MVQQEQCGIISQIDTNPLCSQPRFFLSLIHVIQCNNTKPFKSLTCKSLHTFRNNYIVVSICTFRLVLTAYWPNGGIKEVSVWLYVTVFVRTPLYFCTFLQMLHGIRCVSLQMIHRASDTKFHEDHEEFDWLAVFLCKHNSIRN